MLTALKIGNFKAFAKSQRIPIRPLTLIYGANSSGKSSILHSLIMTRDAKETGNFDIHRTTLGGESVDLGGFRQFVHQRDVSRRVELTIEMDTEAFTGTLGKLLRPIRHLETSFAVGIALDDIGLPLQYVLPGLLHQDVPGLPHQDVLDRRLQDVLPELHSYEVLGDGQSLLRMSRRSHGKLQLDQLNNEHKIFRDSLSPIIGRFMNESNSDSLDSRLDDAIAETVPRIFARAGNFLPQGVEWIDEELTPISQESLLSEDKNYPKENLLADVGDSLSRTLNDLLSGISVAFYEELNRLQYLGPLRSYPPRYYTNSQYEDPNWYSGGGYAWDVVRRNALVRKSINGWLSAEGRLQTPYELVVRSLVRIDQLDEPLFDGLEQLELVTPLHELLELDEDLEYLEDTSISDVIDPEAEVENLRALIQNSDIEKVDELTMIDRRSNTIVSHRDVGIGVSQVLPVLVGAYSSWKKIIAIEQPEIHLHPALQADLADVFIQSALGKSRNRFLIETHSEHLLLRVMRRMRETSNDKLPEGLPPISSKDVCVLFVQPKGTSSRIRHMELDDEGKLLDAWPGGFFEEGFRERFA